MTYNKSTQLNDAFIGPARQRRGLIGCSETRSVGAQPAALNTRISKRRCLPSSSVQFSSVDVL